MNQLIRYVDSLGMGQTVYNSAGTVIKAAVLLFFILYRNKYRIPLWKTLVTAAVVILGTPCIISGLAWIDNGFENFEGGNILRAFTYFPLLLLLIAKLLKVPAGTMMDYATPSIMIWHIIGQSVCPFLGCCSGIPCSWGIWNPAYDEMVFPTQWLICLTVLAVMIYIMHYEKRHDYDGSGKAYPIMLVIYGPLRFLLEFLKQGEKVFLGISGLGIHALLMTLVGTVWLFTLEEIKRENNRKAERNRQSRRIYSPQRASTGYPKEDKV